MLGWSWGLDNFLSLVLLGALLSYLVVCGLDYLYYVVTEVYYNIQSFFRKLIKRIGKK